MLECPQACPGEARITSLEVVLLALGERENYRGTEKKSPRPERPRSAQRCFTLGRAEWRLRARRLANTFSMLGFIRAIANKTRTREKCSLDVGSEIVKISPLRSANLPLQTACL